MTDSGPVSESAGGKPRERPRFIIDPKASRFTVQAFSGGMLSALGHNPKFESHDFAGEVAFDPDAPNGASLRMTLPARSLALADGVSGRDRETILRIMHEEVLESVRFPEITYRCADALVRDVGAGQLQAALDGELTLHGVTRAQRITARLSVTGPVLRAVGEFTVRQSEFDITQVTVAGSMLKVKDELTCSFAIVARRSSPSHAPS